MKQSYLYKVVRNNLEFPQLFEEIHFPQTGETVSVNSFLTASLSRFFNLFIIGNHAIFSFMMLLLSGEEYRLYNFIVRYVQNNMPNYFCVDFGAQNG